MAVGQGIVEGEAHPAEVCQEGAEGDGQVPGEGGGLKEQVFCAGDSGVYGGC